MTRRNSVALGLHHEKGAKMYTANSIAKKVGTTVRTVQYYDKVGLFSPVDRTDTGYRLYSDESVPVLKEILFYRYLEIPIDRIKEIMSCDESGKREQIIRQAEILSGRKAEIDEKVEYANIAGDKGITAAYEMLMKQKEKEKCAK